MYFNYFNISGHDFDESSQCELRQIDTVCMPVQRDKDCGGVRSAGYLLEVTEHHSKATLKFTCTTEATCQKRIVIIRHIERNNGSAV